LWLSIGWLNVSLKSNLKFYNAIIMKKDLQVRTYLLLLLCLSATTICNAQLKKGYVFSADGQPLADATIFNCVTKTHSHTDTNGFFEIAAAATDSVAISHIAAGNTKRQLLALENRIFLPLQPLQLQNVQLVTRTRHLNVVADIDTRGNPVNSAQELLRKVPGLLIGQHAGGGKAEQIFLRGFDIDHGTDINISVDGMPVNMVSHAHGQGYADLHFLIPELMGKIDFDKGPYQANYGNMATAGYVAFTTKEKLDASQFSVEGGQFGHWRTLTQLNLLHTNNKAAWLAADYNATNGYFESPQQFKRLNLMGKFTSALPNDGKLSVLISHFNSSWNASGQIPQRAVDNNTINWFGAIDDTEGGQTSRFNLLVKYQKKLSEKTSIRSNTYFTKYDFELYSNFTFFLNDSANGDQIKQKEERNIFGTDFNISHQLGSQFSHTKLYAGIGLRYDDINDVELSRTANRKTTLRTVQLGDIQETNGFAHLGITFQKGKWLINPALRADYFNFNYSNQLLPTYQSAQLHRTILSPKLNVMYQLKPNTQLFFKAGRGFHSNDTRVIMSQQRKQVLPAANGVDAGLVIKPAPRLIVNAALWYLYLQQEFVYVGDEGIVEPGGRTARKGIDVGLRYQLGGYLFIQADATYTHARALDELKGENFIPLAPKFTATCNVSLHKSLGWNGSANFRWLGNRPANADASITAAGYAIMDLNVGYNWPKFQAGVVIQNLLNTRWKETQFATNSRLQNEPAPVEEIHFTPGTPFNARLVLAVKF
jgi:outer membrane receptor protein involved in Fe transport